MVIFLVALMVAINGVGSLSDCARYDSGIMSSREVKVGMRGYGLSVFQGTRIERFPLVVVGKLKSAIGDQDMILVKLQGGYPVNHGTGIIAGMSGSPVYINGRLIGAIGYGWPFSKEAIGGVTPIQAMMQELPSRKSKPMSVKSTPPIAGISGEFKLEESLYASGKKYNKVAITAGYQVKPGVYSPDTMVMTPVSSLLEIQGFSGKTVERFQDELKKFGLQPVAVPGGGKMQSRSIPRLQPGSAVGVTFIDGDLYMGGNGTMTYRKGDTVLAFGHPFMYMGKTKIPFHAAYIQGILPSLYRPFKFSSSIDMVGTLVEDRLFAVSARLGEKPPMIPVTVDVVDQEKGYRKRYNLRCLSHPYFTPILFNLIGYQAMNQSSTLFSKRSVRINFTAKIKNYEKIDFEDYASGLEIQNDVGACLGGYLKTLALHDFEPVEFEKLYLKFTVDPTPKIAKIEELTTQYPKVAPGDKLEMKIRLKTEDGKTLVEKAVIPIPPDIKKGSIKIGAGGGSRYEVLRKKLAILPIEPVRVSQLVSRVRRAPRGNELVVEASFPRSAVTFAGERLTLLSRAKASIFDSSPNSDAGKTKDSYTVRIKLPCFVDGEQFVVVGISEKMPSSQDSYDTVDEGGEGYDTPVDGESGDPMFGSVGKKLRKAYGQDVPMVMVEGKPEKTAKAKAPNLTGSRTVELNSPQDYFLGVFDDTSISNGIITLGRKLEKLYFSKNPFIWAMDYDKSTGKIYAGESPSGYLLELQEGKEPVILGDTGEILVSSLLRDSKGKIYVGTSPNGRIFRRTPSGDFSLFCTLEDDFVWDLKEDPSGGILAATGNSGRVYRIGADGKAKVIFNSPESHINCLAMGKKGEIYAGSASQGILFRIDPDGKAKAVFQSLGDSIDAILVDDDCIWVGAEQILFRIHNDGGKKIYIFPEAAVLFLTKDIMGNILAGTSDLGRIYRINSDDTVENLFESNINQVMGIAVTDKGEMLAATGNPGKVVRINEKYSTQGMYLSNVIDTGKVSDFGAVQWTAQAPTGTSVTLQTRTGDSMAPDDTWSDWSPEYSSEDGQSILSPPGRYIQIRANLKSDGAATPKLYSMRVFFHHKNHAPILTFTDPKGGERWSGSQTIKWKSYVANQETLAFSIFISSDGGKTWKALKRNINADIQKNAPAKAGQEKPLDGDYKLSTKRLKDGEYMLKLRGFDRTDAENESLTTEIISRPVVICNQKPEVTITSSSEIKGTGLVIGFAKAFGVNVQEALYQIDDNDWALAFPQDGVFDNSREKFIIYLNKPYPKKFKLKVKVTDEAGNSVVETKSITIHPAKAKEEPGEEKTDEDGQKEGEPESSNQ